MATIFRGISFPFKKDAVSLPAAASDDDLIKQSLIQIVLTQKGERVMRPDFGCSALSFVFDNNDPTLAEAIRIEVMGAISRFEPRVIVRSVKVTRDETLSQVIIDIAYIVTATRQEQRLQIGVPAQ